MDLLTLLFRLPFLPVKGVVRLAELIQQEAERELYAPARARRELDEAQRRRDAGEISDEELAEAEEQLTSALVTQRTPTPRHGRGRVTGGSGSDQAQSDRS